jgi:histidinol phosphatase-like enzyme (inositol monophosphatase family)
MLPCWEVPYSQEIEIARRAADLSAKLALRHQKAGIFAENKPDDSPVTIADRECEKLIAKLLEEAFPDDGILGEEGSRKESKNGRRWIIDPIDGTRDFVRGNPLWSVLIALEEAGEVQAGVVHLPLMGNTCWASRGGGAFRNDIRLKVSSIAQPEHAVISLNSLNRVKNDSLRGLMTSYLTLFWAFRCLGGTPDAMMVAEGQMDAWVEPKVAPWDMAAAQVILEEAGAVFFAFNGKRSIYEGNCVACTPGLEASMREFFTRSVAPELDRLD